MVCARRERRVAKGYDAADTVLACYSVAGFGKEFRTGENTSVALMDLDRIYSG